METFASLYTGSNFKGKNLLPLWVQVLSFKVAPSFKRFQTQGQQLVFKDSLPLQNGHKNLYSIYDHLKSLFFV